ncbi:alanyl-tRNA editing protein [Candidatus Micrarchaeota archaeon]|nr:alanyl-tRNA editing protein [Candidatus Micrarchaeota archaeon]MBD3418065.1 alanyl-tRNA editing protein [Candidatus Micrarchaeota archaeon]
MVEKLFRSDPYLDSCKATVTSSKDGEITLDKTVLFAFAGGQQSDSGTIGGFKVLEARAEGPEIFYKLEEGATFKEGDETEVKIDMEKRKKIMRLHSAAHLVYGVFSRQYESRKLIGSNVTEDKARIDFEHDSPISDLLPPVEEEANKLIEENHPAKTYPDENNPDKWWWECRDFKYPCGGTHVTSLGEIGKIKLKRKNIGAGKERIEITLA